MKKINFAFLDLIRIKKSQKILKKSVDIPENLCYTYFRVKEREANKMTKYIIRIFDGENTRVYVTEAKSMLSAENKIYDYHRIAVGTPIIKVTTTMIR